MSTDDRRWPPPEWGPPEPRPTDPAYPPQQFAPPPNQQWPPAGPWGLPSRPPTLPTQLRDYPTFWNTPGILGWRGIVIVVLAGVAFFASGTVVTLVALVVEAGLTGQDWLNLVELFANGGASPGLIAANSIAIGLMVPISILLARISGQPSGYLHSVTGRFRWRLFLPAALIATVLVTLYVIGSLLYSGLEDLAVRDYSWWLLVVLLLVTPFQAAGEEYMLRGLLFRAVGAFFSSPLWALGVGGVINSLVFMAMHGSDDIWLNVIYLAMGLLLSYITWRTGGLEAAVAIHTGNNLLAMGLLAFQDLGSLFDREAGVGDWTVLVQLAVIIVAVVAIEWWVRRGRAVVATAPANPSVPDRRLGEAEGAST